MSIAQSGPTSSALQVNGIISGAQVSLAATGAIAGTPIGQIIAPVVTLNAGGGIGRSTSNPLQLAAQDITALSSGNSVTVASTTYSPGVFLSNVSSSPVTARQIASAPLGTTITSSTADISFVQTGGGQLRIGDASATGAARQAMVAGRNVSVSNNMAGIEVDGIVEAGRRIPGGPPLGTSAPPAAAGQIALTTTTATSDIVLASTAVLITHDPNAGAGNGIVVSAGDDLTIQSGAKLIVGEASTGGPAGVVGQAPPVATVTPQVLSNGGNIAQNGDVALPITIGNATDPFQETNFTVTINWGDTPTPQVDTLTGLDSIGGGGAGFAPPTHRYTAQNPRNTDTIFGSVTVSIDPRIVLTAKTATSAVDLGSTTTTFQLKPPPGGIVSAAVFVARAEDVATVVPVRATVVNAVIPFQLTTSTPPTAMRRIEPERIEVSERKLLLMVVNPLTGDEVNVDTFTNLDSVLNDLPSLFARLLDDRYRLYLEGEDGSRQLVKEFLIRDGKEVELEDTSEANDGSSGDSTSEMSDDGTAESSPARGDQRRRRVGPTLAPVRPGAAASGVPGESDIVPRVVVPARPGATASPAPTRVVPPSAIQPNAAPPGSE
ncbi:MAG TPA: hypothetical protein PLV92_19065, partial [Pirellulaceae bacterium]|nr:hypothetical protein [Pirellulaceae bacterium]